MAHAMSRTFLKPAIGSALLGAIAVIVGRTFMKRHHVHEAGEGAAVRSGEGTVRSAGPSAMRTEPKKWSKEDEASDESFPASDPPGQGVG
jgi:hypothetical protein